MEQHHSNRLSGVTQEPLPVSVTIMKTAFLQLTWVFCCPTVFFPEKDALSVCFFPAKSVSVTLHGFQTMVLN